MSVDVPVVLEALLRLAGQSENHLHALSRDVAQLKEQQAMIMAHLLSSADGGAAEPGRRARPQICIARDSETAGRCATTPYATKERHSADFRTAESPAHALEATPRRQHDVERAGTSRGQRACHSLSGRCRCQTPHPAAETHRAFLAVRCFRRYHALTARLVLSHTLKRRLCAHVP